MRSDVEIIISTKGDIIWVNTYEGCVLRICSIKNLGINDERIEVKNTLKEILNILKIDPASSVYNLEKKDIKDILKELLAELKQTTINKHIDQFTIELREIYNTLNYRNIYGGLVPIPLIKKELFRRYIRLTNELVDKYLLELEKKGIIDLGVASDPNRVSNRELGIESIKRGLLYFVRFK
jgi:hypothetical protein